MNNKELSQIGLEEKMANAKKLRLKKLKEIGINSEEELESILHDEKFSLKNRISNLAKRKSISLDSVDIKEIGPIPENEKSEKLKAYEKLMNESLPTNTISTLSSTNTISTLSSTNTISTLSSTNTGVYVVNRSGRTLYTVSGQPLYHKEVCVKFPSGGKIYMMRTNGTMGYEYLNSTDASDSNFRKFSDMTWMAHVLYYCLRCRGSKVDLHSYNGSYFGYIDYEDDVSERDNPNVPHYHAANSNPLLMSIYGYSLYGKYYRFDGFVNTKLNVSTGMDSLAVYGDPSKL